MGVIGVVPGVEGAVLDSYKIRIRVRCHDSSLFRFALCIVPTSRPAFPDLPVFRVGACVGHRHSLSIHRTERVELIRDRLQLHDVRYLRADPFHNDLR